MLENKSLMGFLMGHWKLRTPKEGREWKFGSWGFRKNKDSIRNRTSNYLCGIFAKNMASFCPCPENLYKVDFQDNELIFLIMKGTWKILKYQTKRPSQQSSNNF